MPAVTDTHGYQAHEVLKDGTAVTVRAIRPEDGPSILEAFSKLDRESPTLHRRILQQWHAALSDADQWFAELANGSARVRIARLLLKMRDATNPTNSVLFTLEDIGSILGMTVETASRVINAFQREGKIKRLETQGRDYQIDVDALEAEAQSDAV